MHGPVFVLALLLLAGGSSWLIDAAGAKHELALATANERLRERVMKAQGRQQELTIEAQQDIETLRVEEGEACAEDCLLQF